MMALLLASASPRRRELLALAGVDFTVCVSNADESVPAGTPPAQAAMLTAEKKARAVAKTHPADTVLGADTIVVDGDAVLGKPHDAAQAKAMLRRLSGKTHTVITGVCIVRDGEAETFFAESRVTFYPLSDAEIDAYVATGEPMDKAGAYGIQGRGCTLVERIEGDYFNIVGLPVAAVVRRLRDTGV
ncbi:MAG: septum formation inhibitor Maf [Clostridia bacterium]|nr:septum formation inhibitor Maf [Clostridia bacterium]